ncbi:hypothetical protein D3C81_1508520 [compost metagenome]
MKTLGQPRQIVFLAAAFDLQQTFEGGRQLGVKILGQHQARQLSGLFKQGLRDADVHQQYAGRHVLLREQRRQSQTISRLRRVAFTQIQRLQGFR